MRCPGPRRARTTAYDRNACDCVESARLYMCTGGLCLQGTIPMIARSALWIALCAAACGTSNDEAPAAWSTVFGALDRVALSVWSSHPDDVYIVGGGLDAPGV